MKITNIIYALPVALLLLLSGCTSNTDDAPGGNGTQPDVYLTITRAAHTDGNESINTDTDDWEDRVHDMALLVFDTGTGNKVAEYYEADIPMTGSNTFQVKLTPGQRDFYFVANMPNMKANLEGITQVADIKTYMNTLRTTDVALYQGAATDKGFPMSRVYINQTISGGGNIYQPLPFKPTTGSVTEDRVRLIRVMAKLEVTLQDFDTPTVVLHNANEKFLLTNPATSAPTTYYSDITLTRVGTTNTYRCYMPEALIASTTWTAAADHKPVNYFTITDGGVSYDIPIINTDNNIADYLAKATGTVSGFTPDYNIWRNHHYKYTVKNSRKIEILYTVNDWDVVEKALFMGYGYNVEVDGNTVTLQNTIEACDPYNVVMKTLNGATFSDGTTSKAFSDFSVTASATVTLANVPASGNYLEVQFNGETVKTFSK